MHAPAAPRRNLASGPAPYRGTGRPGRRRADPPTRPGFRQAPGCMWRERRLQRPVTGLPPTAPANREALRC